MTIVIFFAGVIVGFVGGLALIIHSMLQQHDEAWELRQRGVQVPG